MLILGVQSWEHTTCPQFVVSGPGEAKVRIVSFGAELYIGHITSTEKFCPSLVGFKFLPEVKMCYRLCTNLFDFHLKQLSIVFG